MKRWKDSGLCGAVVLGLLSAVGPARATDIGVVPKKLVVVDKLVAAQKAKVAFVVKDPGVTKGTGEDAEQISVGVALSYAGGSTAGAFVVPAGTANGWVVNKSTVAKYVNKSAPAGPTEAKVAVIKPGKLLKLVGKGLGDTPFDILSGGQPAGSVYTAYCVDNAGAENCHCSEFTGCAFKLIGGGTGAKLVCKTGAADATCSAVGSSTTTSSAVTVTTSTTSTTVCQADDEPCTVDSECCSGVCNDALCWSCRATGEVCTTNSECCAGQCLGNVCTVSTTTTTICRADGQLCASDGDCCSGVCSEETCGGCLPVDNVCTADSQCCSGQCLGNLCTSAGTTSTTVCRADGQLCSSDADCCSALCADVGGTLQCVPVSSTTSTTLCRADGQLCSTDAECCTSTCVGNVCGGTSTTSTTLCRPAGQLCSSDGDCCSNLCLANVCS